MRESRVFPIAMRMKEAGATLMERTGGIIKSKTLAQRARQRAFTVLDLRNATRSARRYTTRPLTL